MKIKTSLSTINLYLRICKIKFSFNPEMCLNSKSFQVLLFFVVHQLMNHCAARQTYHKGNSLNYNPRH